MANSKYVATSVKLWRAGSYEYGLLMQRQI